MSRPHGRPAHNRQTPSKFWARVQIGAENKCWPWLGATNSTGYGSVGWDGEIYTTHRIAAWLVGMIFDPRAPRRDAATHVLHTCDNRICCNPNHFFLGTYADNNTDAYKKKRHPVYRGSAHIRAKFSAIVVQEIRARYAQLRSYAAVAREYDAHESTIANIIKGRTYADQ